MLTCPSNPNMAAVAKQLHATALQAEAEIAAAEQAMRFAVDLPTVVLTSTGAITGISANVDTDIGGLATFATTFDNTAGGGGGASGAFGPQNFSFFTSFLGAGIYQVGMCLTAIASGVVNDNTVRFFFLEHRRPDPSSLSGETILQRVAHTLFEPNTGVGVEASFMGEFRAEPNDRFAFMFNHANTSSTMNISTGMIIWATKQSESTLTRVL